MKSSLRFALRMDSRQLSSSEFPVNSSLSKNEEDFLLRYSSRIEEIFLLLLFVDEDQNSRWNCFVISSLINALTLWDSATVHISLEKNRFRAQLHRQSN